MIVGRSEFIHEFIEVLKHDLDRLLPLKAEEDDMLKKTQQIVTAKIDHIRFSMPRPEGE